MKNLEIISMSILAFAFTIMFTTLLVLVKTNSSNLLLTGTIILTTLMMILYIATIMKELTKIFYEILNS